jgi:hypothetical protein
MRRLLVVLGVLLALVVAASPAQAAGNAFHFSVKGPGAEAFWSTFPTQGEPQPGVVYTDTYLQTAAQAVREDGTRFDDKFLFIDQFSYKFDRRGNFIFVSETFGFASGNDVNLTVDARRLTTASVTATVALTTCTEEHGEFVCVDAGTATVHAAWTGTGELLRVSDTFRVTSKTFTEVSRFRGTFRDATATGGLNGTDFGTSQFADIFNASSADLFVCHGC